MKILLLIIFVNVLSYAALAQKERKFVREGNDYFNEALKDTAKLDTITFGKAEVSYRKALQIKPEDFQWQFNLADAIYKQKKGDQAATEFEKLADKAVKPNDKASVYYNLGNSLLTQKKYDPSIDAYKKALRINPTDPEAKYNLAFAEKMKKEDQKKKDKDKKDKDKDKKDKDKDKNKDQDKKDQNKDNKNQDQNQQNQQNKPQQNKISKQSAEQMLQALENEEQKTQEKVKKAQVLKAERNKIDKNW